MDCGDEDGYKSNAHPIQWFDNIIDVHNVKYICSWGDVGQTKNDLVGHLTLVELTPSGFSNMWLPSRII